MAQDEAKNRRQKGDLGNNSQGARPDMGRRTPDQRFFHYLLSFLSSILLVYSVLSFETGDLAVHA